MTEYAKKSLQRGQDDVNSQPEVDGPKAFPVAVVRHGLIVLFTSVRCNRRISCFGSEGGHGFLKVVPCRCEAAGLAAEAIS